MSVAAEAIAFGAPAKVAREIDDLSPINVLATSSINS
jgi:hypothetical protein